MLLPESWLFYILLDYVRMIFIIDSRRFDNSIINVRVNLRISNLLFTVFLGCVVVFFGL